MSDVAATVQIHQLLWGDQEAHTFLNDPCCFDFVLGADVAAFVYHEAFGPLVNSLKALSHAEDSGG